MTASAGLLDIEVDRMLAATAEELFARHAGSDVLRALEPGGWSPELWALAEEVGLPTLEVPEEFGGAGGTPAHVASAVRSAGRHAAQIPLADTALASWALAQVEISPPRGPLALVTDLSGTDPVVASAVPYARHAVELVVVTEAGIATVAAGAATITPGLDPAGEARDHVVVDRDALSDSHPMPPVVGERLELRAALFCAARTVGALDTVQRLTLEHVRQREQFGTAIARLPVVRERLALLAEEVAAAAAALDLARLALSVRDATVAVAAAKIRSAEAAGKVSRIAHQLHGAIGVTTEHPLQLFTRRLWAWRDECGDEPAWARRLGAAVAFAPGSPWERVVDEGGTWRA